MVKDTEDKAGHCENNEEPNGKCSKGFGVASWITVEMMKWIDGNLHVGVEVRVAVGMENQIGDVDSLMGNTDSLMGNHSP